MALIHLLNKFKKCKRCGKNTLTYGEDFRSKLAYVSSQSALCYECAYWQNLIDYPLPNLEVMKGVCYQVLPEQDKKDKSLILGGNGKLRYFLKNDFTVLRSNDVWVMGKVPESFASDFPNTIIEINRRAYNNISKNSKRCKARSCLNRYMCLRYIIELEQDEIGAYNKVPKNWNPKKERCRWFVNKEDVIDDSNVDNQ